MHRKKILLVDDSRTILMLEKFILRNDPYVLITATSGEEAIRKAAAEKPDLIVSGVDVCRLIREHEELRDVPLLLVGPRDQAGSPDFIPTPINAPELLAKVRAHLSAPVPSPRA